MMVPVLPETAPFTVAQRAWLNGFFAGLLGSSPAAPPAPDTVAAPSAPGAGQREPEETFPWHDPGLALEERLALSQGKPLERRLMSAMAQLNCGACGYQCKTYAEAIAGGTEKSLTLCSPGGASTAKALRSILRDSPPATGVEKAVAADAPGAPPRPGTSRKNPFAARLVRASRLCAEGGEKDVRHVVFDLEGSGLSYEPGDSLGVFAENSEECVERSLKRGGFSGDEPVPVPEGGERPLREALLCSCAITALPEEALELILGVPPTPGAPALDLDEALEMKGASPVEARALVERLLPLAPRLYSISSSLRRHPDEVHLTVGVVRYRLRGRDRVGVASTFLAERARAGQRVPVFIQKSHGFRLPADPSASIVMIGPGTGIAPFRAFLEERAATGARGRNWLFFGEQRRDQSFLYREELETYLQSGLLTRLDLAFSRDQAEKIYVQHLIRQNAGELWRWLEAGAHLYVCGDAQRMARDVDQALREVAITQSGLSAEAAREFLEKLTREGRYLKDCY